MGKVDSAGKEKKILGRGRNFRISIAQMPKKGQTPVIGDDNFRGRRRWTGKRGGGAIITV